MQTFTWMSQSIKIDFTYGIRPIYYLSRLVGLWPFSIVSNSNGMVQRPNVHFYDALWFLVSAGFYVTAIFISYQRFELHSRIPNTFGSILACGFYVIEIMGLILGIVGISINMFNRDKLANVLQQFTHFDDQVSPGFN